MAGLQEVRWSGSGKTKVGDTTFLWSGRQDNSHREGVSLVVYSKLMSSCIAWIPVNELLLISALSRRHFAGGGVPCFCDRRRRRTN